MRAALLLIGSLIFLLTLQAANGFAAGNGWTVATSQSPDIVYRIARITRYKWQRCQSGQQHDPSTGVCFSCSHNDHFENGTCVPCKMGFHEEGDECVMDAHQGNQTKGCSDGMELKHGKCRKSEFPPIEQCADGQQLDPASGTCFSCSHNDHFENGKCMPCQMGFHVEGEVCAAD